MAMEILKHYHNHESKVKPQVDENKITLYANQFCPFSRRVMLMLKHKNLDFDFVGISLQTKPGWYLDMTSTAKVPLFKQGSKTLWESLIIANYLDEAHPPTIHPTDPYLKARGCLLLDDLFAFGLAPIKALKANDFNKQKAYTEVTQALSHFNSRISGRYEKYLQSSDGPKYVDYMIWPFVEMFPAILELVAEHGTDAEEYIKSKYSKLSDYRSIMREDPAVQKVSLSKNVHKEYLKLFVMQRLSI